MARVLIVTSGPLCRNPRVLKEATALGEAGYEVTVLAPASLDRYEAFDREILHAAPFRKVVLEETPSFWPRRLRSLRHRSVTWLARRLARVGIESAACFGPVRMLRLEARRFGADLTIVHTESGLAVGADLIGRGRPVAVDFEDWHSRDLLPGAQRDRPLRLLRRLEGELCRRSLYSSAPSEAMSSGLCAAYGGVPPLVIRNVFPLQAVPAALPHSGPPALFWFSQTIGQGRMLEPFLAAWCLTRQPSRLCLLGDVSPDYRNKLIGLLPAERRLTLEFLPLVPPGELPGVIAQHDLGLALEGSVPESRNLTITNKLFQYLNAGLGVLASDTAGQREALALAPGACRMLPLMQSEALATLLDELIADSGAIAAMGAAARKAAAELFCWEREKPRLLAAVALALGRK